MKNYINVVLILILIYSLSSLAKPQNSDQVIPTGNSQDDLVMPDTHSQAEDDAIHAKIIKNEDVNEDAAQNRLVPPPASAHTYVVPNFSYEDDGATESAADQLKIKIPTSSPKAKPTKHYASVHVGAYDPTNLQGDTPGISYENVYNGATVPMVQVDMEWDFFRRFGKLGGKAGIGFFTATGTGRFVNKPELQSDENLNLFVIPLTAAGVYHLQYWDKQPIVPYVEGGVDYFGMFEINTQATKITQGMFGGSPAAHYAAGLQIQLDFLDRAGVWNMTKDYGIRHLYFIAGVRQFFALGGIYDFSAMMFEGGFAFEF